MPLPRRDRRGWTVGNNVAHYSEALEWPVADWRVFCRIPVAPSTNIEGREESPALLHATFTRLSTSGYLVTLSFRAGSSLSGRLVVPSLSVWSLRHGIQGPKKPTEASLPRLGYVAPVRGESDVLTVTGLTSAVYESESILYGVYERSSFFSGWRNAVQRTRDTEENESHEPF